MIDKKFDPATIEPKIARAWEDADAFRAGAGARGDADPYCIMIPPPNVTGSLHIGHALNNTLQDILIRYNRMKGRNVLWQPGMDHAGIATQMVVERQMDERGEPGRKVLGREAFIEKVWEWKAQSGGTIINQLKRLGASCDWSRERFTMDEGLSDAVCEVFVSLYKQGVIYKDKRLVNWDPKLLTAISDLEIEQVETNGHLWHFRYPLEEGVTYSHPIAFDEQGNPTEYERRNYLVVATTRPETMLGDTGVAVYPDDRRYQDLIGKHVILPLVGRKIPIVADEYPNPDEGSGAVKMTPAHDFNDFEVGKRAGLDAINIMTVDAHIWLADNEDFARDVPASAELEATIKQLEGLERFEARKQVVAMMESADLLDKIEDHAHMVPHGDRGRVPIESLLTDQWYVNAGILAEPALNAVRSGDTRIVPESSKKTYYNWMENIQPWCISRQLWWGHQIPAWYGPDGHVFVEKDEEAALHAAVQHYIAHEGPWKAWVEERLEAGEPGKILTRDPDVLDTWFSSALWPFSTLGWPEQTSELSTYYKTDVLITGFDILFFWVARMMMMGLHFMDEVPFHTVYLHGLVRDKQGDKMSKTRGNVIDPLDLMDEYGTDAVRFTLAALAVQGRDIKLDEQRIAGYRNFGTKLWNAARFAEMNGAAGAKGFDPDLAKLPVNRWLLTELSSAIDEVSGAVEDFRYNEAAAALYRFVWNQFCDWYLELLKPIFGGEDEAAKAEAQGCAAFALETIFGLLHPFMPFITEELWSQSAGIGGRKGLLCHQAWPELDYHDELAADQLNWLVELISSIRSARAEMNIAPSVQAELVVVGASQQSANRVGENEASIARLARISKISFADIIPDGALQVVIGEATYCMPLGDLIDVEAETKRVQKEQGKLSAEAEKIARKLENEGFLSRAPQDIVEAERNKLSDLKQKLAKLADILERLATAR